MGAPYIYDISHLRVKKQSKYEPLIDVKVKNVFPITKYVCFLKRNGRFANQLYI